MTQQQTTSQASQTTEQPQTHQFSPVLPGELKTSHLSLLQQSSLWLALNYAATGGRVWVACSYSKQTEAAPRVEHTNYIGLPGVSPDAQIGPIVRVFRTKEAGLLRFTIFSITRQGFTTIIPDGLDDFVAFAPPDLAMTRPGQE